MTFLQTVGLGFITLVGTVAVALSAAYGAGFVWNNTFDRRVIDSHKRRFDNGFGCLGALGSVVAVSYLIGLIMARVLR